MSLATLLKPRAKASSAPTDGIIITDPEVITLAAEWLATKRAFESADSNKKLSEAALKPACFTHWIQENHGRAKPESSVKILTPGGKVTCSFQARWFPKGDLTAMGVPSKYVRHKASIKIDIDLVPEPLQEKLASAVLEIVQQLGCEAAAEIKFAEYPNAEFEAGRHTLSPETNLAIETAGLGTVCALRA